ncbi:hypothetical protein HNQ94_000724 [Salirhabdus euzebyi]|uniref:WYL domain-containing protein n=1 Tax=Salirhabdus euzebyi TaxID=394506 RepID=A0A841PTW7_9BACI|nr:WYL domain-containing protein [Salirhabdus euzebyi]MBB6452279.1 hypothetical protein [Salirhabdus euzebyi]
MTQNKFKAERLVEIIYMSANGKLSQRLVKIQGENKEKYFGYCYLRRSFRSFYKNRILAMEVRKKQAM